jgi:hypothetical protein
MEDYKAIPAKIHRARGRCCKSACLHCPYGFTLKNNGLTFSDFTVESLNEIKAFFKDADSFPIDSFKKVLLKDIVCAYIRVDKLFVRDSHILEDFSDQGLSKEIFESYYFY